MNYTMITNHVHTCTPPFPLGEPEFKKVGFVVPILKMSSAKISKAINMLCKHGTTNVNKIKMKWYKY